MLLTALKQTERNQRHKNRNDYLLLFSEILWLQYRVNSIFRGYLVIILKALVRMNFTFYKLEMISLNGGLLQL